MTDPQTPDVAAERPPYLLAGLVALGALVLYVLTLAPTTQFWDASEYITAAHALGIPHPPGSPLFVILAHAWGLLPLGVDYARRINLFAATTSAVAAGLWFLIGERWLRPIVSAAERRRLVAGAGGGAGGGGGPRGGKKGGGERGCIPCGLRRRPGGLSPRSV